MAMQSGIGLSKIVFIVGAGYTGTIFLKNNTLSQLLGDLQNLVKGLENSDDSANADIDPIAAQVRWLAQEVRQLANTRQITVLNGSSGRTDVSSLILPAATLGALGYGYMWWKGYKFSDLMYVTKSNMAAAVASLTQNLQSVNEALEKAKKHLLQRLQILDGKIDEQRELSKMIMTEVRGARGEFVMVNNELHYLQETVSKLTLTLMGVDYLVQFAEGKSTKIPSLTQEFRNAGKSRGLLPSTENIGLQVIFVQLGFVVQLWVMMGGAVVEGGGFRGGDAMGEGYTGWGSHQGGSEGGRGGWCGRGRAVRVAGEEHLVGGRGEGGSCMGQIRKREKKEIYKLPRMRDKKTRDIGRVKCVKDIDHKVFVGDKEIKDRWRKNFDNLFNGHQEREYWESMHSPKHGTHVNYGGRNWQGPAKRKLDEMIYEEWMFLVDLYDLVLISSDRKISVFLNLCLSNIADIDNDRAGVGHNVA
ncbi:hypothetical protein KSS87_008387 [Heliosperma pusillum]|nr:hypothetical protein KSS87_008387 [Heliosperma pusillum]